MMRQFRTFRRAAVLLVAALATTACLEDELGHEAEVEFMQVTVGGTTVTVNSTGAITGGPISMEALSEEVVSVVFLDADMADALTEHADDYQLNITTPAELTFTRNGAYGGSLLSTSATPGTYNIQVSLFHIEESHTDFGAFGVPITVTAAAAPTVVAGR